MKNQPLKMEILQAASALKARAEKADKIRATHGNSTIVLYEVGNYYEAYNESAEALHDHCDFTLIYHGSIAYTDFATQCADWIIPRMIRAGYKLCINEKGQY